MDSEVSGYVQQVATLTRRARNVFLVAVLLCGLLALNVTALRGRPAGRLAGVCVSFGPLLFWSLVAAAYAFHSVARVNARLAQKMGELLAADRSRARRLLSTIRARLRTPARRDSH